MSNSSRAFPVVEGRTDQKFEAMRDAFARAQADDPGGAQLCVYQNGQVVVDLWTGRDLINDRRFSADTPTVLMSASKGITAITAHMLVERGELDLDAPVSVYWPEFAQNGKGKIPVRYLLSHQAGLAEFPANSGITLEKLLDWDRCVEVLAEMAPLWTPGSAFMYHAATFGYLIGEVIRRVSGKTVGQSLAEGFRRPLGLDLWLGDLPASKEANFAPQFTLASDPSAQTERQMLDSADADIDAGDPSLKALKLNRISPNKIDEFLNARDTHLAEIPAANAVGNARSLARLYAATIGEVNGIRLLNEETMSRARVPQTDNLSRPSPSDKRPVLHPSRFALGFQISSARCPMLGEGSFGHSGRGGRLAFAHPETGTAVGYTCNNMAWDHEAGPDARWLPWIAALNKALVHR
ncbi:CubicO group peptidase (beta-lactamase class C family) [Paraburkholderia sp. BL8N3]|nr:serine hydrolase domain-containing protein [Paraburkholderia sp. BL8N3]TCK33391.1 CubicO group peptidase (beta-lactamase class C family) [Paraburkholderia sp. BL8N3]